MRQPLFINNFQKGSSETGNIGFGAFVGIETYTKKGIARLTRETVMGALGGGGWLGLVKYIVNDDTGVNFYAQGISGSNTQFYVTVDLGVNWATTGTLSGAPMGLMYFQGYLIAFQGNGNIYYSSNGGVTWSGAWKTWSASTEATPFIFPNDNFIYFGNGNKVGKIGFGSSPTFDPTGTSGIDYFFSNAQLTLPSFYQVNCMSFLPINFLALGTSSTANPQVADIILWNPTLSTYETPLRLYSRGQYGTSFNDGGVRQILNRNNILYAVTGGNHCIFQTNGTNFSLIDDVSLHSNIRTTGGTENNMTVFTKAYPMAIAVQGNKLLTGASTPTTPAYPSTYGLYPVGVWSVSFTDGGVSGEEQYGLGGKAIQLEYTISTDTTVATTAPFEIGCIFALGNGGALISWRDASYAGSPKFGVDYVDTANYQDNINDVMLESPMMQVGQPLTPSTIQNIEFNFVRNLMTSQSFAVYYRTGFDQDFALVTNSGFTGTFTGDGTTNSYKITGSNIGQVQYIQFQIRMTTGGANTAYTPELRNIIIS